MKKSTHWLVIAIAINHKNIAMVVNVNLVSDG